VEPKLKPHADPESDAVEPATPTGPDVAAEVTDLRFHLLKARLRVAVESIGAAERLLRSGRDIGEDKERDARALLENARRELEQIKSLMRGDDSV
jgi:hypothetical protein